MATQGVSSHQFTDAAIRGTIKSSFIKQLKAGKPYWERSGFEKMTSTKPFEEFTSFTGTGIASRKEEFQQVSTDAPKQNYTKRVSFTVFAMAIPVSEEALRFLKRGSMSGREFLKPATMAANSMKQTNEILGSDVFGNAFDANYLGPDGVSLVSNAHKLGRGGTSSNYIGKASFSQTSIEAADIQADRFPDDVGLQVGVAQGKKKLLIPPEYKFEAKRILNSTQQSDTANNAINALKDEDYSFEINPYLPSVTSWFKINEGETDGLYAIFETEPEARDFSDDKTHTMFFEAYEMVGYDFGLNWRRVQGSDF